MGQNDWMRHVLVHGYFEIDQDIVWSVVENELPALKEQIEAATRVIYPSI